MKSQATLCNSSPDPVVDGTPSVHGFKSVEVQALYGLIVTSGDLGLPDRTLRHLIARNLGQNYHR